MQQRLEGFEQQAQQHDAKTTESKTEMMQHIQHQHSHIQEQRQALIRAQTELNATIDGKRQYEVHAQEEMENVARNYQHLEAQAHLMHEHQEHQLHAKTMHEAQQQETYIAAWKAAAHKTEQHIANKQQELQQVERNLETYAEELYAKDVVQ